MQHILDILEEIEFFLINIVIDNIDKARQNVQHFEKEPQEKAQKAQLLARLKRAEMKVGFLRGIALTFQSLSFWISFIIENDEFVPKSLFWKNLNNAYRCEIHEYRMSLKRDR